MLFSDSQGNFHGDMIPKIGWGIMPCGWEELPGGMENIPYSVLASA